MFKIAKILSPESPPPFTNIINYNMSKIPAINEIDANSPSQESKEVVIKATDVSPDVNGIQETISGAATIQEVDCTRKPTISEIYKIVNDGLFESTSNWWDYAYKLPQSQINQDIIARLDRGEIGGGYSKGVDIITTTSNKVPSNTNVYSALKSDTLYPKKLNNETINGIYNFINGITIGKPTAYTGGTWSVDQLGKTHLTTDYLYVRLKAIFETLQILNVDTIGGKLVISPAGSINIVYVDNIKVTIDGNEQNVYRCYFLGEQEGEEIENKWKVGDQAQAKSFNVKKGTYHKTGNHYLWRLVVGVSTDTVTIDGKKYHYIDLSQLISDVGSDAPAPGDVLNQLGHRGDDLQRQTAIVLNAVDNYAPSITLYAGINDFTLLNKEYVEYGVYQGKAFFNVYGDMYIGDKGANPTTYIKYKNGKIDIKANLTIGSSIDGKDLDKYIKENGGVDEETVKSLINNAQVIKDLQNQVDAAIETWFYEGEPTLRNLPAVDWTTNEIKKIHVGDLYYDQITGFAYRFTRYNDDVNPYAWNRINDNDIVKALEAANNAQITADGKMKIFYNTKPTDYQVGDVWILPADTIINGVQYYKGDILTATVKSTKFNEKHWTKKVRYIGSKELNDNIDKVNKKINDISATTLPGLNDKFNEFAKDGILDSSEKARLTDLLNQANNEVLSVNEQITNIIKSDYLTNGNINKDKLIKAQKTLSTSWTEYKTLIDTLIVSTNSITKNNIAEASSKYTNLQNSIKAVKQYLAACQADILSNIGIDISSYKYLKEAFKGKTEVNGGLVVTNVLQLRQTSDVNSPITAGISGLQGKADKNGVVDKDTYDITSIAAWFGGPMVDKDIFTDEQLKNKVAGTDYARSLFRHDGSGYLASGAIYWGTDGILHGNPNSFILQGTSLAIMLSYVRLFYLHYANTNDEGIAGVDYITPTKTFSRLDILTQGGTEAGLNLPTGLFIGSSTTGGSFQVGNVIIRTKDGDPNILEIVSATDGKKAHLGVQGGVSAYGTYTSSTGGGDGLNAAVVSYANIIAGNYNDTDLTTVPNAYSIKALYTAIQNIDVSTQLENYLLKTDASTMYQPKGNYLTNQSLDGYATQSWVNNKGYITSSGSCAYATSAGNADTIGGYHASYDSNTPWGTIPVITTTGWMDIGKHLEFHKDNSTGSDYSTILRCTGNYSNIVSLPSGSGTLALTSDIPTKVSSFSNDSGYITSSGSCSYASSAGNATSANSATKALTLTDYNDASYSIYCGWVGAALASDELENIVGLKHTNKNIYYKDVSKSTLQAWLGLGARAYDNTNYLPLSGGTMSANARISASGGKLYIGNADNSSHICVQDMSSQVSTDNWQIRTSGAAKFKDIYIAVSDSNFTEDSNVIEDFTSTLCLNWYSSTNINMCNGGGIVKIGTTLSNGKLNVGGNILATGGVTAYSSSDIRLKQNLHKLNYLNIIKAMGGSYGFTWRKDNKHSIGWIAQHILNNPYMSDIVETDENGYYKINYWSPKLIATAFGAIEQVDDEVSKLKARVTYLESEVERLTNDNRKLEATNNNILISK